MRNLILDLGSNHNNDFEILKGTARYLDSADIPYLKLQLFPKDPRSKNIYLDRELFKEFVWYCREKYPKLTVFASVWDQEGYELLRDLMVPVIKFAWSQKQNELIETAPRDFKQVFVSYSFFDEIHPGVIPLLCIPEYPVLQMIHFVPEMFFRFHGFSDHTLGFLQSFKAIETGCVRYLEKHIQGIKYDSNGPGNVLVDCPDSKFAIGLVDIIQLRTVKNDLEN